MNNLKNWVVTERAGKRIEGQLVKAGDVLEMPFGRAQAYFNTGQLAPPDKPKKRALKKVDEHGGD